MSEADWDVVYAAFEQGVRVVKFPKCEIHLCDNGNIFENNARGHWVDRGNVHIPNTLRAPWGPEW